MDVHAALGSVELVFLPLGREYASVDAGLAPLARGVLLAAAVAAAAPPDGTVRAAKPHIADALPT
jgi:hypothetical protein